MAVQKARKLHIPHKFGSPRQQIPDVAGAVQSIVQGENVTAQELQDVLKKLFAQQIDPTRQNWLELERWADQVKFTDTTGGGGSTQPIGGSHYVTDSQWLNRNTLGMVSVNALPMGAPMYVQWKNDPSMTPPNPVGSPYPPPDAQKIAILRGGSRWAMHCTIMLKANAGSNITGGYFSLSIPHGTNAPVAYAGWNHHAITQFAPHGIGGTGEWWSATLSGWFIVGSAYWGDAEVLIDGTGTASVYGYSDLQTQLSITDWGN